MNARSVIITADDLGLWPEVNDATMAGHDAGIITSASLRVSGSASHSAMVSASMRPQLGMGLHLVLCDGQSTLPRRHIPNLTDSSGRFVKRPLEAVWLYRKRGGLRQELAAEIRAQIEKFLSSGLFLSHISSHFNLHLQPAILSIIKELAHDYPISAIRKPGGPVWRAAQSNRLPAWQRRLERSMVRPALAWGRVRSRSFLGPDRVRLLCPDRPVTEFAVAAQLAATPRGLTEYVCHPGSLRTQYEGRGQQAIVTSPTVRDAITQAKLELMSYRDLAEGS